MIGGRWEENGRGYEGTGEDAMERGDRLWYRLLFSTSAKEYFRRRLIYPVTMRKAICNTPVLILTLTLCLITNRG